MKTAVALFAAILSVATLASQAYAQKGFSNPKAVAAEKLTDKNSNSPTKSKNPIKSSDIHSAVNTSNILVPKPRNAKEEVWIATSELGANLGAPSGRGATSDTTGGAVATGWREVNGLPSAETLLTAGSDTSFGTRSGGGFMLASDASIAVEKIINTLDYECEGQSYDCQGKGEFAPMLDATPEFGAAPTAMSETDEANPNDSPGPKPVRMNTPMDDPAHLASFCDCTPPTVAETESQAATAENYALIASLIGIAVTGGETDEYGEPTAGFGIEKAHY